MHKFFIVFLFFGLTAFSLQAQSKSKKKKKMEPRIVEASCGQCNFGLAGSGCKLAVRIDDKAYYVDGSSMKDHGDAHGAQGMCNVVREARVEGKVVLGRFKAKSMELLPMESKE